MAATPFVPGRFADQFGDVEVPSPHQHFFVYGRPKFMMQEVINKQNVYIYVCLVLQIAAMVGDPWAR